MLNSLGRRRRRNSSLQDNAYRSVSLRYACSPTRRRRKNSCLVGSCSRTLTLLYIALLLLGGCNAQFTDGGVVELNCTALCSCRGTTDDGDVEVLDLATMGERVAKIDGDYSEILDTDCGTKIVAAGSTLYTLESVDDLIIRDMEVVDMVSGECVTDDTPSSADCYIGEGEPRVLDDVTLETTINLSILPQGAYKTKVITRVIGANSVTPDVEELCLGGFIVQLFSVTFLGNTYPYLFELAVPGEDTSSDLSVASAPSSEAGDFMCGETGPEPTPAPEPVGTWPPTPLPPTPAPVVSITPIPTSSPVVPETPSPVVPETPAPVEPDTPAPVEPDTPAPVEPDTPAPVVPETPAPVEPDTPAPVEPDTPAPVEPDTPAPVEPDTPSPIVLDTPVPTAPVVPQTPSPARPPTSAPVPQPEETEAPEVSVTPAPQTPDTPAPSADETSSPVTNAPVHVSTLAPMEAITPVPTGPPTAATLAPMETSTPPPSTPLEEVTPAPMVTEVPVSIVATPTPAPTASGSNGSLTSWTSSETPMPLQDAPTSGGTPPVLPTPSPEGTPMTTAMPILSDLSKNPQGELIFGNRTRTAAGSEGIALGFLGLFVVLTFFPIHSFK